MYVQPQWCMWYMQLTQADCSAITAKLKVIKKTVNHTVVRNGIMLDREGLWVNLTISGKQ